jgi:hypothetical protein
MPIRERDPWRLQYFTDVECPGDVFIATDDADGYLWNPAHRWVYNKLTIAESQGLECAPHGVDPPHYPVFSKPIFNLDGMGVGSRRLSSVEDYAVARQPGHMWMRLLEGEHVSSDAAVVDGKMRWIRHVLGLARTGGTFDYWTIEDRPRPILESYCARWIESFMAGYTGMLNIESIDDRIIEVHLRFADQWPDLYGRHWLDAVVNLYARGIWHYPQESREIGFSVVLFGPHLREYRYPEQSFVEQIAKRRGISSVQITFHQDRPASAHAMPPSGFRLAIVNARDLEAGRLARAELAGHFGVAATPPS